MGKRRHKLEQLENKIGYWAGKGVGRGEFVQLTNFGLRLLKFVEAPAELLKYSGYLVEVTQELKRRTEIGYIYIIILLAIIYI